MQDSQQNNKRIAKNTLLLYVRMFFTMAIGLYTSRVVLATLGVEDYGIYNVVGGVVAMFGFLNGAMSSATSRYITFALGKGDEADENNVFVSCVNVHFILSVIIFVLAETVGLWYVYTYLVVPPDRFSTALWVYQCSVIATLVMIMSVPYNACIIAHEKMSAFAYISIIEVIAKLGIVYLLLISPIDKLIVYAILVLTVQMGIRCCYTYYCDKHFKETKYRFSWDGKLIKELFSFAVWSLWGNMAATTYTQGLNLMLNAFFGPVVNAARGISVQVQGVVSSFISNFQMAVNPQITKSYAAGDKDYMVLLMCRSARFSYFLMLLLILPIIFEADMILKIWLGNYPSETTIFLRLMLCTSLIYTMSNPLVIAAQATGRVRKYQAVAGSVLLSILPIAYVCLKIGLPAWSVFVVHFCVEFFDIFVRAYLLRGMMGLSMRRYVRDVMFVTFSVTALATLVPLIVFFFLPSTCLSAIVVMIVCFLSSVVCIYTVGLSAGERVFIVNKISYQINRYRK